MLMGITGSRPCVLQSKYGTVPAIGDVFNYDTTDMHAKVALTFTASEEHPSPTVAPWASPVRIGAFTDVLPYSSLIQQRLASRWSSGSPGCLADELNVGVEISEVASVANPVLAKAWATTIFTAFPAAREPAISKPMTATGAHNSSVWV